MKSLNVKKIAVAAIGAAMIGAAFAGAVTVPSSLSSYQFFSNGSPQVKIVVGSAAQASDAIAAANIAAMIGNLAYTSTPVSINGESGLACTGSAGTASCGGGSATIQVTTPGINPATAYQMTTLIDSSLNANYTSGLTSQNRNSTFSFSTGESAMTSSSGVDSVNAKITPSQTPVLHTTTLNIGSNSIQEEEDIYAGASNQFSTTYNNVISNQMAAYYVASFTGALPMCTNTGNTIANCDVGGSQNYINDSRNIIQFLGQPWVVEGFTYNNASNSVTQLTLGQESSYQPQMAPGQTITASNGVKITLNSISSTTPLQASFNVTATDGTTQVITLGAQNDASSGAYQQSVDGITISVEKVFPGITAGVQYAQVSIYSNQIYLSGSGGPITGASISSSNQWYSYFQQGTNGASQGISKIIIVPSTIGSQQQSGTSFSLTPSFPLYNLNYIGLTNVTTTPITFSIQTPQTINVNQSTGCTGQLSFNAVQISPSSSDELYDTATGNTFNTGYLAINSGTTYPSNSSCLLSAAVPGMVYYPNPNSVNNYYINTSASNVQFKYSSSLNSWPSLIWVDNSPNGYDVVGIQEATTGVEENSGIFPASITAFLNLNTSSSTNQFTDGINSTTSDSLFYNDSSPLSNGTTFGTQKVNFITDRGSVFSSIGSTSFTINYADSLAGVEYTLTPSGVNASGSGANTANYSLTQGQSQSLGGGYSITLASVGSGSSTSTGGNATVTGVTGLAASPANADTVVPLNTASTPLVEFDSQASTTQPLIVVGGPMVNTVAASLASQGSVSLNAPGDAVVQQIANDILVAGYTAADTQSAANALISWMAQNAASIAH